MLLFLLFAVTGVSANNCSTVSGCNDSTIEPNRIVYIEYIEFATENFGAFTVFANGNPFASGQVTGRGDDEFYHDSYPILTYGTTRITLTGPGTVNLQCIKCFVDACSTFDYSLTKGRYYAHANSYHLEPYLVVKGNQQHNLPFINDGDLKYYMTYPGSTVFTPTNVFEYFACYP